MHNLTTPTRQAGHEVEPLPVLAGILAAARRCEPWLIALLAVLQLAVITIGLAGLTAPQTTPPPDHPLPSSSPRPSPTPVQET